MADRSALRALTRKLERWELEHLRDHIEELRAQLDAAEQQIHALQCDVRQAESWGQMWHDTARAMEDDLEQAGGTLGLTQAGQMVVLHQAGHA